MGYMCVCVCVCVCYWPPVCEVFPNYEVVVFHPQILTTPDLGSFTYCYIGFLLNPPNPLFLPSDVRQGKAGHSCLAALAIDVSPHGIIHPTGRHPYPSLHTPKPSPAFPSPVILRFRFLLPALAPAMPAKPSRTYT